MPTLVRPPGPLMLPVSNGPLPLVSKVPPPEFSVTARLLMKPDRNCKAPPPNARLPELSPRLLSADTANVPPLTVVPPR